MGNHFIAFLMVTALGVPADQLCGTLDPTNAQMRRAVREIEAAVQMHQELRIPWPNKITFPTVVHVPNPSVPDSKVTREIERVNKVFKPLGFQLELKGIRRYDTSDPLVQEYMRKCFSHWRVRRDFQRMASEDPRTTLNIYTCDPVPWENSVAMAYLPWDYPEGSFWHGITLEDEQGWPYLEHELGHYLGLLHTFRGGCTDPNDWIVDTPAQRKPFLNTCPERRDSCKRKRTPGLDPVRNFMGYAGYRCVDHFTDDQQLAMLYSAMAYRPTIWALSQ